MHTEHTSRSRNDYLIGVSAVASPILGTGSTLIATISLGGRSEDFAGTAGEERAAAVRDAAARLSRAMETGRR